LSFYESEQDSPGFAGTAAELQTQQSNISYFGTLRRAREEAIALLKARTQKFDLEKFQ
jgi:hypothetical protein